MQRFVLVTVLALGATPVARTVAQVAGKTRVAQAAAAWLRDYRRGGVSLTDQRDRGARAPARRHRVLPGGFDGRLTARREVELLGRALADTDTPQAAAQLLELAAVGLAGGRYTPQQAPHLVRAAGEAGLARLRNAAAWQVVVDTAAGRGRDDVLLQAAALRALGARGGARRTQIERRLEAGDAVVRRAAAEALARSGQRAAVPALLRRIGSETDGEVLQAVVGALRGLFEQSHATPPDEIEPAAVAVAAALGRAGWRADDALVEFLGALRSASAVPALIEVLQRFVDHPEQLASGASSGLLRHRAHELLQELTGALFPAHRPDLWLAFWHASGEAPRPRPRRATAPDPDRPGTASTGFFGLPVHGSHVVFLVDLSESMAAALRDTTRLDRAKQQLLRAVLSLPATTRFNLVTFRGHPDPDSWPGDATAWQEQPVAASDQHKQQFARHVQRLSAEGGTNTWAGLQAALGVTDTLYPRTRPTDELFVLSDGMPSVGLVVEPEDILRLVRETNRFARVRIHTVYIADPADEAEPRVVMDGAEFLRRLAAENGGRALQH